MLLEGVFARLGRGHHAFPLCAWGLGSDNRLSEDC